MELLQLNYFCDSAKTENFSATAKKYMVPTSAVSQSIKRLENELGCKLFTRQANRIKLNAKGKVFYEKVREGLNLLEDAKRTVKDDNIDANIKISIFINRRILMQTVEKFNQLYPQVNIVTRYMIPPEQEEFDFIITDAEYVGPTFAREKLIEEDILLAVHKDFLSESKKHLDSLELKDTPFICTNPGSSLHRITEEVCMNLGFSPRIVIRSDDPYYVRKCVETGLGVCLMPSCSWQGQFSKDVLFKNIANYSRPTYAYRSRSNPLSKYAKTFLEMLRTEFQAATQLNNHNRVKS